MTAQRSPRAGIVRGAALLLALLPSVAAALPFTGSLQIDLRIPGVSGTSQTAFDQPVALSGGGLASGTASSVTLPGGALAGAFSIPGPLRAAPVTRLAGSFSTRAGTFLTGTGGVLGGTLGLDGSWQFELLTLFQAQLPVTPIGVGGSETVSTQVSPTTALSYQLDAGAWTSGSASVSIPGVSSPITASGFDLRDGNGVGSLRLVSPIRIIPLSAGPSAAQYAAIATLDLSFVPEPGTALLLGLGFLGLGATRSRRRNLTAPSRTRWPGR